MQTLQKFADHIWTCTSDLSLMGVELGARMTIVDLDGSGTLFVHSPIKLTPEIKNQIDDLGQVTYVVAPNKWHHLFIKDFKSAYPSAQFFAAPGLEIKRKDFQFDGVISSHQTFPWKNFLEHKLVLGIPIFNEVVFFEPKTRTVLLTDLALHICESHSLFSRIALKLLGSYGRFGWAPLEKLIYIRNKKAFKQSIHNILEWDIDKVLLTHGEPLTANGKKHLQQAFL